MVCWYAYRSERVTREWVGEGELPKERRQSEVAEALRCRRVFRACASNLASNESLSHQHMRVVYHRGKSQIVSTSESHGGDLIIQSQRTRPSKRTLLPRKPKRTELAQTLQQDGGGHAWELQSVFPTTKGSCLKNIEVLKQVVERGEKATTSLEGLTYPKAKRWLKMRWTPRSATVPQRQIYRSRRKGRKCKATNNQPLPGGTTKIGCRRSISAVCGRFKEKSTVDGRLKKKKERRGKEEEEKKKSKSTSRRPSGDSARGSPVSRRRPRCSSAVVAREPSPPASDFSPHAGESSRRHGNGVRTAPIDGTAR
ncbi:hypothetical protein GW17_00026345 [Ensete ventricosum]|nr:hypothetical protein GW17_00026345 [Ensete ventricosum]